MRNTKLAIGTAMTTVASSLLLGIIIFYSTYFQNLFTSPYNSEYKFLPFTIWFVSFAIFGISFYFIFKRKQGRALLLIPFILQIGFFMVYVVASDWFFACFTALVSCTLGFLCVSGQAIALLVKRRWGIFILTLIMIAIFIIFIYKSTIFCFLEYGEWKD